MNWIEFFGFKNFFNWISMGLKFYYNPKKFFKHFYEKPDSEKLAITTCYLVVIVLLHTVTRKLTWDEILPYLIFKIILVTQNVIILSIISFIIYKKYDCERIKIQKIFYYIILSTILFEPIFEFINFSFLRTEHFFYSIIDDIAVQLLIFLHFIYFNFIFYKKRKLIILGIILNIIGLNLSIVIRNLGIISSHDTNPNTLGMSAMLTEPNEIFRENQSLLTIFPLNDVTPLKKYYLKYNNNISVIFSYKTESANSFISNLPQNMITHVVNQVGIKKLNSSISKIDSVKYKHNQYLLDKTKLLYASIDKEINYPEKDSVIPINILKSRIILKGGYEIYISETDDTPNLILKDINRKQRYFERLLIIDKYAILPIGILISPGIYIANIIDPNNEI